MPQVLRFGAVDCRQISEWGKIRNTERKIYKKEKKKGNK